MSIIRFEGTARKRVIIDHQGVVRRPDVVDPELAQCAARSPPVIRRGARGIRCANRAAYSPTEMTLKAAPIGSAIVAIRPNGVSSAGVSSDPPRSCARAMTRSVSSTP